MAGVYPLAAAFTGFGDEEAEFLKIYFEQEFEACGEDEDGEQYTTAEMIRVTEGRLEEVAKKTRSKVGKNACFFLKEMFKLNACIVLPGGTRAIDLLVWY